MMTMKPAKDVPLVLSFDGEVLDVFRLSESVRVHISLLDNLDLKTDKKGQHTLDINKAGGYTMQGILVDEDAVDKVTKLIAEVQKAKAQFKFD